MWLQSPDCGTPLSGDDGYRVFKQCRIRRYHGGLESLKVIVGLHPELTHLAMQIRPVQAQVLCRAGHVAADAGDVFDVIDLKIACRIVQGGV